MSLLASMYQDSLGNNASSLQEFALETASHYFFFLGGLNEGLVSQIQN